jgi:hypothetical protein
MAYAARIRIYVVESGVKESAVDGFCLVCLNWKKRTAVQTRIFT